MLNEQFLIIKKIDTDIRIPNDVNKFYDYRLKDLLDEYYNYKQDFLKKQNKKRNQSRVNLIQRVT